MTMQYKLLLEALLALVLLNGSACELFPLSDTAYPHVWISDPATVPVTWHRKIFAFR
jgi:hypothetical protein